MKSFVQLLLVLCLFASCSKKDNFERVVNGRVYNKNTGAPLSNASITISAQVTTNGVFNSNLTTLASTTTDANGNYTVSFKKANTDTYHIRVGENSIFSQEIVVGYDQMFSQNPYVQNFEVYTSAQVFVHLKNSNLAADSNAVINYKYSGRPLNCNCCTSTSLILTGAVDTTVECKTYGDQYYPYFYSVSRNGQGSFKTDSVYIKTGESKTVEILY